MGADPVAAFAGKKYLSLETYKKSGTPVRTVVWFAVEDGKFYFHTPHKTWKLKRIRKNPAVRMAPSSFRGKILGDWFDGKGQFRPAA